MAFKIVETVENYKKLLSVIPSAWEKDGYLYWTSIKRVTKLQQLLNDPNSEPLPGWSRRACKLKRQGILTFAEAEDEIDLMENNSGTSTEGGISDNPSTLSPKKRKVTQRASKSTLPPLSSTSYNDIAKELLSCQQPPLVYQLEQPFSPAQEEENCQKSVYHLQAAAEQSQITVEDIESNICLGEQLNLNVIAPTLQYLQNEDVLNVQEITLGYVLQEMNKKFNILVENQQKIIHQLSKQQTMIDHLLESRSNEKSNAPEEKKDQQILKVIETIPELDDLETKLFCTDAKSAFIQAWSKVCGTSGKNKGGTCSYRLIDKMISRHLLTEFSWGGGTRQKEGLKFAFKKYRNILQSFYEIIQKADREFTYTDCEAFFKTVIRNSTHRVEVLDNPITRMSASRKRLNKSTNKENRTDPPSICNIPNTDLEILDNEEPQKGN